MKPIFKYKIRDTATGLFSPGGTWAANSAYGWDTTGKLWNGIGPLRSHLTQIINRIGGLPTTWEVVEYELTEKTVKPVTEWLHPKKFIEILKK